jgi:hypothetical protein
MPSGGYGGYGNPQSPNGTIGGGNATESSAHPITGEEEDSFDLSAGGGAGSAVRGSESGAIFVPGGRSTGIRRTGPVPSSHIVRRGDTLWAVTGTYFDNPYQWPRVWSYNPQIRNPNWIYPGDEIRLRSGGAEGAGGEGEEAAPAGGAGEKKGSLVDRRRKVPHDTVFLRDQGWVQDGSDEVWGEVTGSARETMFLTDPDDVYLAIAERHEPKVGQELTVFRTRETVAGGAVVQILGTARVEQWDPREHIARAKMVESLDVVERGAKVGPLTRRFAVVPPRRNDVEVKAHVLASVRPNEFFGQNQVVFIDKGAAAGLAEGNRLFVIRRGDAWRRTLVNPEASYRISPDDERPLPPMEKTPAAVRDESKFPEEIVAELRVLSTKKDTAVCMVTQAKAEIDTHDVAITRKGY